MRGQPAAAGSLAATSVPPALDRRGVGRAGPQTSAGATCYRGSSAPRGLTRPCNGRQTTSKAGKRSCTPRRRPRPRPLQSAWLRVGTLAAPRPIRLPLLPSGPDGVHSDLPRKTRPSTPAAREWSKAGSPWGGVLPRCSGLRVQGTASSPPSTTFESLPVRDTDGNGHVAQTWRGAEGEGFEPSIPCGIRAFQARALDQLCDPSRGMVNRKMA